MLDGLAASWHAAFITADCNPPALLGVRREQVSLGSWEVVMENWWRDVKYGARMLVKAPGFTRSPC